MKALLLTGMLIATSATVANAQSGEDCAKIEDGATRLLCYDGAFRVQRESRPSEQSDWDVTITTSRLDDNTNVMLLLNSIEQISSRFTGRDNGRIYIHCRENVTSLYITMADHFLADIQGYGEVTYRLDTKPAQKRSMTVSTDNMALGLWNGGNAIPFIRAMFGAENMLVQITPFSESAKTVDFRVAGLEEAIAPLREACNW